MKKKPLCINCFQSRAGTCYVHSAVFTTDTSVATSYGSEIEQTWDDIRLELKAQYNRQLPMWLGLGLILGLFAGYFEAKESFWIFIAAIMMYPALKKITSVL